MFSRACLKTLTHIVYTPSHTASTVYRHHHPKRLEKSTLAPGRENSFFFFSLLSFPCFFALARVLPNVASCRCGLTPQPRRSAVGGRSDEQRRWNNCSIGEERGEGKKRSSWSHSPSRVFCVPFLLSVRVCFVCWRECVVQLLAFSLLYFLFVWILSITPLLSPRFTLQIIHTLYINISFFSFVVCSFFWCV